MKILFGALCFLLLSGCAMFHPVPIALPEKNGQDYQDYKKWVGPDPETTLGGIKSQVKAYKGVWLQAATERREANYWSNEGVFAGTITVAAAGVRQSTEGGLIGSILAAGSALFASHYALDVQARNYEAASDAMACIVTKLSDVSDTTFDRLYAGGRLQIPVNGDPRVEKLDAVPRKINEAIQRIVQKLRKAQSAVQLATPDASAMRTAYENVGKAKQPTGTQVSALLAHGGTLAALSSSSSVAHDLEKLLILDEDLETCVASFSS